MDKKVLIIGLIAFMVMIFTLGCINDKEEPIKIGAVLPLTGPASSIGEDVRDGMYLAASEINSHGGVNGRQIEFIIEDSKTNAEEGISAFKKIEEEHHPDMYISVLSSVSEALAPVAEENKVVIIGTVVTTPDFTKDKNYVFRYFSTANGQVPPVLSTLDELNVKNLGIIYLNDPYGKSFFGLAKEEFEKTGGTVRYESFETGDTNFKEKIAKLDDTEAIYVVGMTGHIELILKQLREENFNGYILSTGAATVPSVVNMPEAEGVYAPALAFSNPEFILSKDVSEKYKNKYNKSLNHYSANGYDAIKLLGGLFEGKEVSRENMKVVLDEGFIYSGVLGNVVVKPGEHDIEYAMYPARIVNKEVKYL